MYEERAIIYREDHGDSKGKTPKGMTDNRHKFEFLHMEHIGNPDFIHYLHITLGHNPRLYLFTLTTTHKKIIIT